MVLRRVLALAAALWVAVGSQGGIAPVAVAAPPDSASRVSLALELSHARWARVTSPGRAFEVEHPRVSESGIEYLRAKGFPPRRPALFVGAAWDSVTAPPNPIAWVTIQRVERAERHWGPGAGIGGALGFCGGLAVGVLAGYIVGEATHSGTALQTTWIAVAVGCAVVGAYALGADEQWVEVPIAGP